MPGPIDSDRDCFDGGVRETTRGTRRKDYSLRNLIAVFPAYALSKVTNFLEHCDNFIGMHFFRYHPHPHITLIARAEKHFREREGDKEYSEKHRDSRIVMQPGSY